MASLVVVIVEDTMTRLKQTPRFDTHTSLYISMLVYVRTCIYGGLDSPNSSVFGMEKSVCVFLWDVLFLFI